MIHLIALLLCFAQQPPTPQTGSLQQGVQLANSGQFPQAIVALESFVTKQPNNPHGWLWLGHCYHAQRDWEKAFPAHEKAAGYLETAGQACFNLARAWAAQGDADQSFDWLAEARDAGYRDWAQMWLDPDLLLLREDKRFESYAGPGFDYDRPFVEPTTVLFSWHGEGAGQQFGWVAVDAGDVDADGVHDIITSAPFLKVQGSNSNAGRVYLYSGKTGKALRQHTGIPGDTLGLSVAGVGDLNHDGHGDYAASSTRYGHPSIPGSVEVWSGKDGEVLLSIKGDKPSGGFGRAVSSIFDVNGDGTSDLLIGSEKCNQGRGKVTVHSGTDGKLLHAFAGEGATDSLGSTVSAGGRGDYPLLIMGAKTAGEFKTGRMLGYRFLREEARFVEHFRAESGQLNRNYGEFFSSVFGDANGDGIDDVYTADFGANTGGPGSGEVRVFDGKSGKELWRKDGQPGEGLGIGNAIAGDDNGDGFADVLTGAWTDSAAARQGGSHYMLSGKDGSVLRKWTCNIPGANMGFDSTSLPDCNGDGRRDFLFTAASSAVRGANSGSVYLVSGALPKGKSE